MFMLRLENRRRFSYLLGVAAVACLVAWYWQGMSYGEQEATDRFDTLPERGSTVAFANAHVITAEEIYTAIGDVLARIDESYGGTEIAMRKKAEFFWMKVRETVLEHVAMDAAQVLGISVSDEQIEKEIERLANKFGSWERVMEIYEKERGIPRTRVREKIKREVITRELVHIRAGLSGESTRLGYPTVDLFIKPEEIRRYYEENIENYRQPLRVKARFIIILFSAARSEEEATQTMEKVMSSLESGEDFGELAKAYSHGPYANEGGLWEDFIEKGTFPPIVEDALFTIAPGECRCVMVSGKGYYIFRVEERLEEHTRPFAEVEDEIQNTLRQERINEALKKAQKVLIKEAFVWPENLFESK